MKRTARFRIAAVAAVATVGLVLTGCAGGGAASPSAEAEVAKTLSLPLQAPPSNFSIGSWSGGDAILFLSVYDTIVSADLDGAIVPSIAESWEYSEDRTELTFQIRGGMTFTDGTPVDAAAVAASLEVAREGTSTSQNLAAITSIEVADESTVVVTLSAPDAALLGTLSGSAGAIGATDVLTAESSQLTPVGSGAYVLDEAKTTAGSVYTLTRNPDNWNVANYPYETVTVTVIPDPTAVQNALQSGQLDYGTVPTADIVKQFDAAKFTSGNNLPTAVGALWLVDRAGAIVPALGDVRVREAINLAFDRVAIADALNPGAMNATNQILNPNGGAFDEKSLAADAQDIEEAKELMAEAGYADGFAVTMPSTIVSTTYESIITQSLSDIGIAVTWETVPFQDFYAKVFGGSYGMFFMFNGFSTSDAVDLKASLSGVFNPFGSTTPELDALLAAANSAPDDAQDAAFAEVNQYLIDEAWFSPLSYATGFYIASNGVDYTPPAVNAQSVLPWSPAAAE